MAAYDLTPRIAPNLDRHLVFPLLEFLQERQIYPNDQILKAKIQLLNNTNMVDYAMDIHKSLYQTEEVPQDMVDRRVEVVTRLKALEEAAAPLVSFLLNPSAVQELKADKQYNLHMLRDRFQIGPEQIEALYQYAKFQFECGNYSGAADYLYQYRALCTNSERSLSALWGKLAAEILMQNWDIALEELNRLKEIIDSKSFPSALNQVQSRIWLMHWSLFIFFNHENGRAQIIDLFNQDKYLNAIQTNAPHLLRYLAVAFIVNKRRRPQFKDFIKVIQQEQYSYVDPIIEFLTCMYVNYDFDGAQEKMRESEEVILNDPFLAKRGEDGNFNTVPLRDEFLENARLFIFETYCRIHQRIDIGSLVFHDFVAKCLTKEPRLRPTASEMLKHKFIEKCKSGASAMLPKIEKARQIRASMVLHAQSINAGTHVSGDGLLGPKLNEDYGGTVPSKPQNVGLKITDETPGTSILGKRQVSDGMDLPGEGDFGTVIVHSGAERNPQTKISTEEPLSAPKELQSSGLTSTGGKSVNPWVGKNVDGGDVLVGESHPSSQTIQASSHSTYPHSDQNCKMNSSFQGKVGGGNGVSPSKNDTVGHKAFSLQDKLRSIYAAGNTVPIPFLRATDISPIALLSENLLGSRQRDDSGSIAVEALQELFIGDGPQSKKGRRGQNEMPLPPSVYQRLTSSSTLLNLAQALSYHKTCYEEMPLQDLQAAQEQQTIQNLCDTLRTILRL